MKAVISGATRGIGKAIGEKLAELGYDLVLLARNKEELEQCKSELSASNVIVEYLAIDLSQQNVQQKLKESASIFEDTSVLVNNLGVYSMQNVTEIDISKLKNQMDVNLYSAIALTQQVLKQNIEGGLKNIVNIASVMSLKSASFAADYSMSKHAFKAWNDALREELRTSKIKVSAIFPGSVNTSSWDGIDVDRSEMIQAEDIAEITSCILAMKKSTLVEEIHVSPLTFKP
ncbi:MAG: short-subunit dehydrogenase [Vicingaceae bacterium]|jgi:short-subunit dehydrogenase